jgi:hypothetical protein
MLHSTERKSFGFLYNIKQAIVLIAAACCLHSNFWESEVVQRSLGQVCDQGCMHHNSWKSNESVQGKEEINWITVRDEKADCK